MNFTVALMIAVSYWGARDHPTPCHPVALRVTSAQMAAFDILDPSTQGAADMRTDTARCTIYIGPEGAALRTLDEPAGFSYCAEIVHEVGHIDGLGHEHGGVMNPDGSGHVPWACLHPHRFLEFWRRSSGTAPGTHVSRVAR